MRLLIFGAYILVLAVSLSPAAYAADVECVNTWNDQNARRWPSQPQPSSGTCDLAVIRGTISKGDFEKVLTLYRQNHPFLGVFLLLSPGGDVDEAIKIGGLFRKYLIHAIAPERVTGTTFSLAAVSGTSVCSGDDCVGEGHVCVSACALIWVGAPERSGTVGLHRPYYSKGGEFGTLTPADAASAYTPMLSRVSLYLEQMEVPRQVVEKMTSTGSGEVEWLNDDPSNRPPSFTEWKDAACGHFTKEEDKTLLDLEVSRATQGTTRNEQILEDMLIKKKIAKVRCENDLLSMNRQKLTAP